MRTFVVFLSLTLAAAAGAELVLDQEQALVSWSYSPIKIGGERRDRVAQVFEVGLSGALKQVELPIGCESGTLIVEIVNTDRHRYYPDMTTVRARTTVAAAALPMPPGWQTITFDSPVLVRPGDMLAILLRNETGVCAVMRGGEGNPYRPGSAFWSPGHLPPDNWPSVCEITPGVTCDLPFRTYVDVPPDRARFCEAFGFGALPIPHSTPVCRCLEDEGIHEQRCTLLHPAFAIVRRIPRIVKPGEPFTIRWTVWPIGPVKELSVLDEFTSAFEGPKTPLQFVSPNGLTTLEYTAIAPKKGGTFKVESAIGLPEDKGTMRSVITVQP